MKEQIADLFLQYRQDLCDTEFAPLPFEQYTIPDLHNIYADKVCNLLNDKPNANSLQSNQQAQA